jgi:hypothetical protein
MDAGAVRQAAGAMDNALRPYVDRDWRDTQAGGLEWSCWTTAAHIAHDLFAYAGQVAGQPTAGYLPYDLTVAGTASPAELLDVAVAGAALVASVVDTADPATRAWHWGPCDPGGFAAMANAEILLHTVDLTRGLGVDWSPPADLCAAVLDRLFPHAPPGEPVPVLLWCTGRGELAGRERPTEWVWKAARG